MELSSMSQLAVYLALVAAVAERITASVKHVCDLSQIKSDKLRAMVIHGLAFGTSVLAAVLNPPTTVAVLKDLPIYYSAIIVGLLGSTGSNVLHDLLSTLTAFKENQKQSSQ